MIRDHSREHKVLKWRKDNYPKWKRFVEFFAQIRKQDRWKKTSMTYNDVVDEFEKQEQNG